MSFDEKLTDEQLGSKSAEPASSYAEQTGLLPDECMSLKKWVDPSCINQDPEFVNSNVDSSLRYWKVTEEQVQAIHSLKNREEISAFTSTSKVPSDDILLRFLLGYNMNIDQTAKALEYAIQWRNSQQIEEIVWKGPLSVGEEKFKFFHTQQWHGLDHKHHPVFFDRVGQANRKEFFKNVHPEDVALRYARIQEIGQMLARRTSATLKQHIDSFVFVFDLEGIGVLDAANSQVISMFQAAVGVMQKVYVGSLYRLIVINAPRIFSSLWKVLVLCIDKAAQEKIEVLGSKWKPRLLEIMPESSIPKYLGGTCSHCKDPTCIPLFK